MAAIIKKSLVRLLYDLHHIRITNVLPALKKTSLTRIYKILLLPFLLLRHAGILLRTKDFISIPNLDLVLTTDCTLKCKDCSNLMPYYKGAISYSPGELIKDLDSLLLAVDLIYEIRLLGGEPFLYPHLAMIISRCLEERRIKKIRIITNGTLMPPDNCSAFLSTLNSRQKNKIIFFISSYPVVGNTMRSKVCAELKNMGYCVYVSQELVWRDEGLFNRRDFSMQELKKNYSSCSLCITLFNHEISMCARAAHGTFLGLIPKTGAEHVKLTGCSPEYTRRQLRALFNREFISTCNYCDNMKNIEIPAATQLNPGKTMRN